MMIFSDDGHFLSDHPQPVGGPVTAKKTLRLPRSANPGGAELFLYAGAVPKPPPLAVTVNGRRIGSVAACSSPFGYRWYRLVVPAGTLRPGGNDAVFSCPRGRPGDWLLALTAPPTPRDSAVSLDGGRRYQRRNLGQFHCVRGEFVVRLRPAGGTPSIPPRFVEEDPSRPALRRIRQVLPAAVTRPGLRPFVRARRLCTWVSGRLHHCAGSPSVYRYVPWDFWAILAANDADRLARRRGGREQYVVMCVHLTVAFVQAATALGLRARCAVTTEGIHTTCGHFFPEVWLEEFGTWAVIDPTGDFCFADEAGQPQSARALQADPGRARRWLRPGPNWGRPVGLRSFEEVVKAGRCYANVGCWPRNDFASHPELTPTYHGSTFYYEPEIVWTAGRDEWLAAFPYGDCGV